MIRKLSVVIPVYDERKSIPVLYDEIIFYIRKLGLDYEIIFIDDGSRDSSLKKLRKLADIDKRVNIIKFRRNYGQSAALDAGFKHSKGDIIITMDSDLQNNPKDIGKLLVKLQEGYDAVIGWRKNRRDSLSKRFFSSLANSLRMWLTRSRIHDSGCTLKAFRKTCVKELHLYGEMHRYIPTLLSFEGFKVGEIAVDHRARKYGRTKYGFSRIMKGFLDLLFIKFWNDYSTRPLHFFGFFGLIQYLVAFLIMVEQIIKAFYIGGLHLGPLLLLAAILLVTGTITFFFGFISEIVIRTYYKDKIHYSIDRIISS